MSGLLLNPYRFSGGVAPATPEAALQLDFNDGTINNAGTLSITSEFYNGAAVEEGTAAYEGSHGLQCAANSRVASVFANFVFGTDDFTVECWRMRNFGSSFYDTRMIRFQDEADVSVLTLIEEKTSGHLEAYTAGGNIITDVHHGNGTWKHMCLERVGTTVTLYAGGVSQGTLDVGTTDFGTQTRMNFAGHTGPPASWSHGHFYFDLVRVTLGDHVYGNNFIPPTSFS